MQYAAPTRLPLSRSYRAGLCFVMISIALVAWLLFRSHAALLAGDYAEWTFHGVLLRDVLQGHADAGYALKHYPVPNSLTTVGLGLLMLALPWKIAAKLWLLAEVVLGFYAAVALQRASGRAQAWQILVLPAAMLLGTTFWFGFSNFNFAMYFAMLLCAHLLQGGRNLMVCAALLLLAFFSHMIPFAFAVLVLGLYAAQTRHWRLLLAAVVPVLLSGWYLVGKMLHGNVDAHAGMAASVRYGTPAFAAFKLNSYLKCWGFINPAMTEHDSVLLRLVGTGGFLVLFAASLIIAVAALVWMVRAGGETVSQKKGERFFWIAVAVFFVVSLVMPGDAAGVSDPGGRMLQVAVWSGLCLAGAMPLWLARTVALCGVLLLATDVALLQKVALQPPMQGVEGGRLPARLRQFAHVYYAYAAQDYREIDAGRADIKIYPTALFVQTAK